MPQRVDQGKLRAYAYALTAACGALVCISTGLVNVCAVYDIDCSGPSQD